MEAEGANMTTEITAAQTKELAVTEAANTAGGEEILSGSIVIPRLLIMQGLSDLVTERKAVMGDMVRSQPVEVLGNPDKPVKFIPITFNNEWMLSEKVGNKFEFRGTEKMTAANENLPWEFVKDGVQWKRTKMVNVYVLLPSDIEAEKVELEKAKNGEMPDPDKVLFPLLLSLRSTSFPAGKDIVTHFAKAKHFGVKGYVSTMELSCYQDKNDQGSFYVAKVAKSGQTPKEYLSACESWYNILQTRKVEVTPLEEEKTSNANYTKESEY